MNIDCWYCYMTETKDGENKCLKGNNIEWCDIHCPIYKNMKAAFTNSNLEEKFWYPFNLKQVSIDKDAVQQVMSIRNNLREFVAGGRNVLLQSAKCGNGKTSWGIKLLQKQIELNSKQSLVPAYFVYVPSLLLEARKSINNRNNTFEFLQNMLQTCPLVLFDEIGGIPLKDYDLLILSTIIETRINRQLSSIFTTNCENDVLKINLGDRLFDRINRLSTVITFKGNSMRGIND